MAIIESAARRSLDASTRVVGVAQNVAARIGTRLEPVWQRGTNVKAEPITRVSASEQTAPYAERLSHSAPVFWKNLIEKKRLLDAGDDRHEAFKTALVVEGGAMAGIASAAMLEELRRRNLLDAFDVIVGQSVGAINAALAVAGQTDNYTRMYTDVFANKKFIPIPWIPGSLNIDYLEHHLWGDQGIDPKQVYEARPRLLVQTTNGMAQPKLWDMKAYTPEGMKAIMRASIAAPYLTNGFHTIEGVRYTDGGIAGLPITQLTEQGIDNLCILSNDELEHTLGKTETPLYERFGLKWRMNGFPQEVKTATLNRRKIRQAILHEFSGSEAVSFDYVYPLKGIDNILTTDRGVLLAAARSGRNAIGLKLDTYVGQRQSATAYTHAA